MVKREAGNLPAEKKNSGLFPVFKKKNGERLRPGIDWGFAAIVLILLSIGTVFVFSSSYVYAKFNFGNSYFFISKQLGWVLFSLVILVFLVRYFHYRILQPLAPWIFLFSYALLLCVFFFGADAKGARRWIYIGGFSVQPSEIIKFATILLIAAYLIWLDQRNKDLIRSFKFGIVPFGVLAVLIALPLLKQPHLSATIIVMLLIFSMMFLGGSKKIYLIVAALIVVAALITVIMATEHGQARIDAWFHPENDIQHGGWQPLQSRYAIGSGGLWGVGLGASKQKHLYLPEPQNDYIFSILCEEMGFVFATAVIILFILLIWRGFRIAKNAPDKFSSLLVMGIICQIAIQVFLNIAVVSGAAPSTGVSLPFFSYGGSSLLIFMAEMGVVLNVSKYSYLEKV